MINIFVPQISWWREELNKEDIKMFSFDENISIKVVSFNREVDLINSVRIINIIQLGAECTQSYEHIYKVKKEKGREEALVISNKSNQISSS